MKAGAAIVVLCLIPCACGRGHLSEAAFRNKADAVCRRFNQRTNRLNVSTPRGFSAALAGVDAEVAGLASLNPPRQDQGDYRDYLTRLRRLAAFARVHGREVLVLTNELERAMPRRFSSYGVRRAMRRVHEIERRITLLERPVQQDARDASADALRLHLPQCNIGATS